MLQKRTPSQAHSDMQLEPCYALTEAVVAEW